MEHVITIHLEGQAAPYRVDEAAYDALDDTSTRPGPPHG